MSSFESPLDSRSPMGFSYWMVRQQLKLGGECQLHEILWGVGSCLGVVFGAAVLSHKALMLVVMPVHDQAIMNNVFAVFGLAGVINAQRELIIGFFGYNAAQVMGHAWTSHGCMRLMALLAL